MIEDRIALVVDMIGFEDAPMGMAFFSSSGHLLRANRSLCRFLGYSRSELTGKTIKSITHPGDWKASRLAIRHMAGTGAPITGLEKRYLHKNGQILWGSVNTRIIKAQPGNYSFTLAEIIDITGRKKDEAELRRHAQITAQVHDTVVTTDLDGRITAWNKAAEQTYGYTEREIRGQLINRLYPANACAMLRKMTKTLKTEGFHRAEVWARTKDGQSICIDLTLSLLKDEHGAAYGMIGYGRDITRRRRLEDSLRESEARLRSLLDNSPDIVDRFDRQYRHLYMNPAGALLHGVPAEKLTGKTIRETGLAEPYCSLWEKRIRKVFASSRPLNVSDSFPTPSGLRYFESLCSPEYDSQGRVQTVLVVSRDITERKRTEEALRESNELIAAFLKQSPIYAFIKEVTPAESRVIVASENYKDMIGIPGSRMAGKAMNELFQPEFAAKIAADDWKVVSGGQVLEVDEDLNNRHYTTIKFPIVLGRRKLLAGYTVDITERKRLEDQLKAVNEGLEAKVKERTARLQSLAAELTQAERKERLRIAHMLHEDLQQRLVAMKYKTESLRHSVCDSVAVETARHLTEALDESIQLTRTLTISMSPPVLRELGLRPSLEWLAADMGKQYGLAITLAGDTSVRMFAGEIQAFAFETVRELLLNVHKHAGVKNAEIRIRNIGKKRISLTVCDKGRGMPDNYERSEHFGLFAIRERAETMGIAFTITSRPNAGTCARMILPTL